jgi:Kef-type K+ transport system membrane component KefB
MINRVGTMVAIRRVWVSRRLSDQLNLATAILDDTIAWVIIAVIAGLPACGTVSAKH